MDTYTIDTTKIYVVDIDQSADIPKREREDTAVAQALSQVLGADDKLHHTDEGKPYLDHGFISITHSRLIAAVAYDPVREVGIDAEEWRDALRRVAPRFLSAHEQQAFTTDRELLCAWTIKEAVYKIVGREAVEFSTAIAIAPDMRSATALGQTLTVCPFDIGATHISLVYD